MAGENYRRTVEELRDAASMYWPEELSSEAAKLSIVPVLLQTQEQFTTLLSIEVDTIEDFFQIVRSSKIPANLFLKHLVLLTDVGGEPLGRINKTFKTLFPKGNITYMWESEQRTYTFKELPISNLTNRKMGIDGRTLFQPQTLNSLHEDIIAILLFGHAATDEDVARVLAKCEVGDYLGKPAELESFVKQRYIWVSRITGGAQANNLGQIAQQFVKTYLEKNLKVPRIQIKANAHMPGVTHTKEDDQRETTFDLVVSKGKQYVGIEISFQVTTNSVIERKSAQARPRFEQIEEKGYKIAYVIDGAGNLLQRESAIRTICAYSHCTVALSQHELQILCRFLKEHFSGNH